MRKISRRQFVRLSALVAVGAAVTACARPEAAKVPTKAVEPTKEVAPPAKYNEAPNLAKLVAEGKLPPVDERLPENPYVIEGLDGIGNYGGTIRRGFSGMADHGSGAHPLYRGLLSINHEMKTLSYLAESWEMSDDAREYTFHLRKGLKWSDGHPMTSEDFRFYYEDELSDRDIRPAHPRDYASIVDGKPVPAEFSAPDDFTVKYKFPKANSLFYLYGGIINGLPARPAHYFKQFHAKYADKAALDKMVEDGEYDDWTQLYLDKTSRPKKNIESPSHEPWLYDHLWSEEYPTLRRNPYFWEVDTAGNQLPYIDKLAFRRFRDKELLLMWVVNGEIDCQSRHIYSVANYTLLKEGEEKGDYEVQLWRATRVAVIHFNMTTKDERVRELFSERDFRIAVSLCVDRDEMIELLVMGMGKPMQYSPPEESPCYYAKLTNAYLDYDPDKANALLDGLGYSEKDSEGYRLWKDGSGERISWTILGGEKVSDMTLIVQDYLKAIGLETNYRGVERALSIERHQSNEVECTMGEADRNLVPLADPQIWVKHKNIDDRPWCNAWTAWYMDPSHPIAEEPPKGHWIWDIWDYYHKIQEETKADKRVELFKEILDIWSEELPSVGFYGESPRLVVVKNGLKGIHAGYGWDCCTTVYEYIIDDATWYWDEPEKHTF